MADLPTQVEVKDSAGTTGSYTGTVGTIATNIPAVAGNRINSFFIRCPNQTPNSNLLSYSIDAGTNYFKLSPGEAIIFPLKGSITQLKIKGNVAGVAYEIMLNFDQSGETI